MLPFEVASDPGGVFHGMMRPEDVIFSSLRGAHGLGRLPGLTHATLPKRDNSLRLHNMAFVMVGRIRLSLDTH
jgi:hypothetical protein